MAPQVTFGAQLNELLGLFTLTTERYSFYLLSSWLLTLHILGQVTSLNLSSICPRGAQPLTVLLQKITAPDSFQMSLPPERAISSMGGEINFDSDIKFSV